MEKFYHICIRDNNNTIVTATGFMRGNKSKTTMDYFEEIKKNISEDTNIKRPFVVLSFLIGKN